ncbi:transporter [Dactylosporangium sp. CA-139066]|uniref:transporter n=1 Tax=Dactylosporangium sp. CA-139066 TaxID=3239930 RepID=UPI003D8CF3DF
MIWLTWRQHRRAALFTLLGLAALAAFLIPTGLGMHRAYDRDVAECARRAGTGLLLPPGMQCPAVASFEAEYKPYIVIVALFMALPLLVGLFWGAPLVAAEVDQGTHRLAWTQGISRTRWLVVKLSLVLGFALAVGAAYAALLNWWVEPIARANGERFAFPAFDVAGVVPVAYTMFAVALGLGAGTLWRRLQPTVATLLVVYIAVRTAVTTLARPNYRAPVTADLPASAGSDGNVTAGNWLLSDQVRDAAGRTLLRNGWIDCDTPAGCPAGVHNWASYQPADRFWPFQYVEAGIFLALAALLLWLAATRLRRLA